MRRHGEEADPEVIGDEAALEESPAPDRDERAVDLAGAAGTPEPAAPSGVRAGPAPPTPAPAGDLADDRLDSDRADGRG